MVIINSWESQSIISGDNFPRCVFVRRFYKARCSWGGAVQLSGERIRVVCVWLSSEESKVCADKDDQNWHRIIDFSLFLADSVLCCWIPHYCTHRAVQWQWPRSSSSVWFVIAEQEMCNFWDIQRYYLWLARNKECDCRSCLFGDPARRRRRSTKRENGSESQVYVLLLLQCQRCGMNWKGMKGMRSCSCCCSAAVAAAATRKGQRAKLRAGNFVWRRTDGCSFNSTSS